MRKYISDSTYHLHFSIVDYSEGFSATYREQRPKSAEHHNIESYFCVSGTVVFEILVPISEFSEFGGESSYHISSAKRTFLKPEGRFDGGNIPRIVFYGNH